MQQPGSSSRTDGTGGPGRVGEGRPRLLDLFCCAGGAGMGDHRAGFEVVGVDIEPQPRYPFEFHQADALEFFREHGHEFDAIHASPPCQAYTVLRVMHKDRQYVDLVGDTRHALESVCRPWVIENVPGVPLRFGILLCGAMFPPLRVYRHRYFESSFLMMQPQHPRHHVPAGMPGTKGASGGRNITRTAAS